MGRLDGKVTIITGASAGIGRAAATLFASEGSSVIIAARESGNGRAVEDEIRGAGGKALFVQTDVTDEDSVRRCAETAVSEYGLVTNLYNNAGGSTSMDGLLTETPNEEFWRAIKLEIFGSWLMSRYCIPEIVRAGGGAIVNTTSAAAIVGTVGRDAYTAGKGAINALTRSMAVEFVPQKVRVNAIAPGYTRTERVLNKLGALESIRQAEQKHLLGTAEPTDPAYAALYLSSDEARMVTGQILVVDGGFTIS
jgi:NAD(P)-dependent dehydrogenase (short-subunit alcohol dehydrogenase family)